VSLLSPAAELEKKLAVKDLFIEEQGLIVEKLMSRVTGLEVNLEETTGNAQRFKVELEASESVLADAQKETAAVKTQMDVVQATLNAEVAARSAVELKLIQLPNNEALTAELAAANDSVAQLVKEMAQRYQAHLASGSIINGSVSTCSRLRELLKASQDEAADLRLQLAAA